MCREDELEIHHVDPDNKVSHRIWSWSRDRIEEELTKCEIRCKECHLDYHSKEKTLPCGTDARYNSGCRCRKCKDAHNIRMSIQRRKRKEAGLV